MKTIFFLPPIWSHRILYQIAGIRQSIIEQHDHYMKQTYRNRCTIAAPDGELALSIPTVKPDT